MLILRTINLGVKQSDIIIWYNIKEGIFLINNRISILILLRHTYSIIINHPFVLPQRMSIATVFEIINKEIIIRKATLIIISQWINIKFATWSLFKLIIYLFFLHIQMFNFSFFIKNLYFASVFLSGYIKLTIERFMFNLLPSD